MSPPNMSVILVMVCFWLTFWLVHRFLVGPIWGVLSEREGRIDAAQRAWKAKNEEYLAATARLEAEMEEAAREATRIRGAHRQQAVEELQRRVGQARAEADERLRLALGQLQAEAETARPELAGQVAELARMLAGRLLGREVRS